MPGFYANASFGTGTSYASAKCLNIVTVRQFSFSEAVLLLVSTKNRDLWNFWEGGRSNSGSLRFTGRFPFDQIFRFEIPGVPREKWNSIFQFVD